jgi:hypothetical protein
MHSMNAIAQDILSAFIIGLVISAMALVKNTRLKALIYTLPIPITVTYIGTGGNVGTHHVIGLFLVNVFLWGVYVLSVWKINIFLSDVIAALAYTGAGYLVINFIELPFRWTALVYAVLWLTFVLFYQNRDQKEEPQSTSKVKPTIKFTIVSIVAYVLLSLKNYLSGIVVTFPFSGVFAVVEGRHMLKQLAATFTRNSIAILAMFMVLYVLRHLNMGIGISIGWLAYLAVLKITSMLFPFKTSM